MGWKNIKEHYRIGHIVQVTEAGICIGSPYIHNIMTISRDGELIKDAADHLNEDLARYRTEMRADPAKLRELATTPDTFTASHPVYTYDGAEIIEKLCETPGWPNITHDGDMMFENMFFADRETAIDAARTNCEASILLRCIEIGDKKERLATATARLRVLVDNARTLNVDAEVIGNAVQNFFPSESPPVHRLLGLIERIAATSLWQDVYPDGPDVMNGVYKATPSDVRACRAALSAPATSEGSTE